MSSHCGMGIMKYRLSFLGRKQTASPMVQCLCCYHTRKAVNSVNERQRLFGDEYLKDLNAEAAAIRAGYSPRYARGNAHKLVANSCIKAYISERMAERAERTEISQDFVLRELKEMASVNATDFVRVVEKQATAEVSGKVVQLFDADGNPVMYRTVEPILTEELTETQKKALHIIKRGRDGFEIKPYDKLRVLELLGKHLGMWEGKTETDNTPDDGFLEAMRGEAQSVWDE
jgi:phage terminase small subunit